MYSESEINRAKKRVKKKKDFYKHLQSYLAVNIIFFFVAGWSWRFPAMFWGIGIVSHYFSIWGMPGSGQGSTEWEEKEVERELKKMKKHKTGSSSSNPDIDEKLELKQMDPRYKDSDFV